LPRCSRCRILHSYVRTDLYRHLSTRFPGEISCAEPLCGSDVDLGVWYARRCRDAFAVQAARIRHCSEPVTSFLVNSMHTKNTGRVEDHIPGNRSQRCPGRSFAWCDQHFQRVIFDACMHLISINFASLLHRTTRMNAVY
jgi:hypothetical protein